MGSVKSFHSCLGLIFRDCVTSTILALKYGLPTRNKKSPWRVASPCIAVLPRVYSMLHVLCPLNQIGSSPWQCSNNINPLVLDSQICCAQGMRRSGRRFHDNMIAGVSFNTHPMWQGWIHEKCVGTFHPEMIWSLEGKGVLSGSQGPLTHRGSYNFVLAWDRCGTPELRWRNMRWGRRVCPASIAFYAEVGHPKTA